MAKIKHIAIATQNEEETARFYIDTFGLTEIGKIDIPIMSGYFLLAVLVRRLRNCKEEKMLY